MIQYQLKLRLCKTQERQVDQWLFHLASVYNFAVRKIELNAKDRIYFSKNNFRNLLAGQGPRIMSGVWRNFWGYFSTTLFLSANAVCFLQVCGVQA